MEKRMLFQVFIIVSSLMLNCEAAPGRAPAVESFVEIEVEQKPERSLGSEVLFNLEQNSNNKKAIKSTAHAETQISAFASWNFSTIMGLMIVLGLPLLSWFLVMNHLREKAQEQSASNIEILSKYREEKEHSLNDNKKDEKRKAS